MQEPVASQGSGKIDESVQAFIKLKELQPQQQALQARLDKEGLDEEDQECLEFINDEIQRLLDILHQHGFNFPECVPSLAALASLLVLYSEQQHAVVLSRILHALPPPLSVPPFSVLLFGSPPALFEYRPG